MYDTRTRERRRLNDTTVLSANHSENEALALGLRDADTHEPVNSFQWLPFLEMVKRMPRRMPKYLIKVAVLPEKREEDNLKSDLVRWLNMRRNGRRRGCQDIRDKDLSVSEVMLERRELERRHERLDIDGDGDFQDPEGKVFIRIWSTARRERNHNKVDLTKVPETEVAKTLNGERVALEKDFPGDRSLTTQRINAGIQ